MDLKLTRIGSKLWQDENGFVVSAEAAMVATLGVVGATVGLDAVSTSVNEELTDVAFAIRSFDQSFSVKVRQSDGAHMAASRFQQADVKESHLQLRKHLQETTARQQEELKRSKQ